MKKYLSKLQGNAKYCIAFHPFWGIPYNLYFFYLSLYLKAQGVTNEQLGTLMVVSSIASCVFSMVAAPIVNVMGRKKATFVFDLLSSAFPCIIYYFSGSFFFAIIAMILGNTNKIMSVAYYLVMIEDASEEETMTAFNLFNVITIVSAVFTPVAGFFVNSYGLVETEKAFLMISFLSMTFLIFGRNHFLKETTVGKTKMQDGFVMNKQTLFGPYKEAIVYLKENPAAWQTVLANIVFCVYLTVGTNYSLYFVPYFVDVLKMSEWESSILGSVYAIGMLVAMLFVIPRLPISKIFHSSFYGALVTVLGTVLLVVIPQKRLVLGIIVIFILSLGYGVLKSTIESALAISTSGESRSGIYSITNAISAGIGIAVAAICGVMYSINQRSVYYISIVLLLVIVICFYRVMKAGRE